MLEQPCLLGEEHTNSCHDSSLEATKPETSILTSQRRSTSKTKFDFLGDFAGRTSHSTLCLQESRRPFRRSCSVNMEDLGYVDGRV